MFARGFRSTIAICGVLLVTTTGCAYKYQFNTGLPESGERVSEVRHILVWGHLSGTPFDLDKACPAGVAEFGSYISFLNWLPAFGTLGLYTPRTVYAVCAK